MAIGIRIPAEFQQMQDAFAKTEAALKSPAPLLKAFGVVALKDIDQTFRAGGRPAWKPLAPSTVAARRQGKGGGSSQPLQNTGKLRRSFDFTVGDRRVEVFSRDPVSIFHEFGTKGPYEIKPKNAKALALPFLPSRDKRGTTGTKAGRVSLAGFGASRRLTTGQLLVPRVGRVGKRLQTRRGKTAAPQTNTAFYAKVIHPGLAERRMFPTEERILPELADAAVAFVANILLRRTGTT